MIEQLKRLRDELDIMASEAEKTAGSLPDGPAATKNGQAIGLTQAANKLDRLIKQLEG